MTTTVNNSESKVLVNGIGFSGWFYKFLGEDIKIGNQILYPGDYEFDYLIKLDDGCKNGHLTFSFTGSIKIKKNNGRYYDYISGAIGDIISHFKPELSMFEKLHFYNHLGQPTYIDDIRCHINEGKTDKEISEMYNISDMKAIKILRNASDNKDLFYYLVFCLGVAENWGNLANEAIREIEKRRNSKLKIENKDRVFKQFPEKECEVLENLYQLGYASNAQKELRDKARKEDQKQIVLKHNKKHVINLVCLIVRKMVNLKVLKPKEGKTVSPIQSEKESSLNDKERGETKQIERDNSIQPKGTKPTVQYTDDMLELVSLDLDSMIYTVNGDIGTEKDIASIVLYDKIGKSLLSLMMEKRENAGLMGKAFCKV